VRAGNLGKIAEAGWLYIVSNVPEVVGDGTRRWSESSAELVKEE
jgi:hypothetical protein